MTDIPSTEEIMAEIRRLEDENRQRGKAIRAAIEWRRRAACGGGNAKTRRSRRRAFFRDAQQLMRAQ